MERKVIDDDRDAERRRRICWFPVTDRIDDEALSP